jgi:hypothetical protein
MAAVNPTKDHTIGIMKIIFFRFSISIIIPNVKIVVGQGKPNVGVLGYKCPN